MANSVSKLDIVKQPTSDEICRQSAIKALSDALDRAKTGDVDECLIILKHPGDGDYTTTASKTQSMTRWIGHIQALQFDWLMDHYLSERDL